MSCSTTLPPLTSLHTSTSTTPSLDGLRALLNEWENQRSKAGEYAKGVHEPNETGIYQDQQDAAISSMYSQYQRVAAKEDKDLVNRWTETLNILLTFAGLLSAVITAFLLVAQPELQQGPNASTNNILLHIARQLDNTTDTSVLLEKTHSDVSALRALSFWHSSLGCSLIAAFGSLLSKQWVLHYQTSPRWANTIEEQCRVREFRTYGLSKWKMYTIIEGLPFLLQLAVLLFYLGLMESVRSTPMLFHITIAFAATIASFYVFTLFAGAIFPSCPYKSPITNAIYRATHAIFGGLGITCLMLPFGLFCLCFTPLIGTQAFHIFGSTSLRVWGALVIEMRDSGPIAYEQEAIRRSGSDAGIVFWWLQECKLGEGSMGSMMRVVADLARTIPVEKALGMATWKGRFGSWCFEVLNALNTEGPRSRHAALHADVICHLVHHSKRGLSTLRKGLGEKDVDLVENVFYQDICSQLQNVWANSPEHAEAQQLQLIQNTQCTTLAVYLRFRLMACDSQLIDPPSDSLLQELPTLLAPSCFLDLETFSDAVIDGIALASISLVHDISTHVNNPVRGSLHQPPHQRLLLALRHLSNYPPEDPPHDLVCISVAAATRVIRFLDKPKELHRCDEWTTSGFALTMQQLMRLGRLWWHAECQGSKVTTGACLVREVQSLMDLVIDYGAEGHPTWPSNVLVIQPESLEEVFNIYAHPQAPPMSASETSFKSIKILNLALAARYYVHLSTHQSHFPTFSRRQHLSNLTWSKSPAFTYSLEGQSRVVRQLIHDLGSTSANLTLEESLLRRGALSAVVLGRDIFLPPSLAMRYPNLEAELARLASDTMGTGKFMFELTDTFSTFSTWDELLQALNELFQLLEQQEGERFESD